MDVNIIETTIDYIEEHIEADITPQDLADLAGYSLDRFYHIFKDHVGMPLKTFMTKLRLSYAIYAISEGSSVVDAALKYGFATHAGFYKAFKKAYGCNPKKYISLREVNSPKSHLIRERILMKVEMKVIKNVYRRYMDRKASSIEAVKKGGGYTSDNAWVINGEHVIKATTDRASMVDMNQCLTMLSHVMKGIAAPISLGNGEQIIEMGDMYFSMYPVIEGAFLSPEERYTEERFDISKKYGASIALLHQSLQSLDDVDYLTAKNFYEIVKGWAYPTTMKILEQWSIGINETRLENYIEDLGRLYDDLPQQAIHRNPNPSNIIFKNGEVTGFIDFELAEKNIRLFDPCYCATGVLSEAKDIEDGYEKWPEILKGILNGYHSINPLSDAEIEAVPYVIYGIQMIFIAYLDRVNQKDALKRNMEMLQWMTKNDDLCFKNIV